MPNTVAASRILPPCALLNNAIPPSAKKRYFSEKLLRNQGHYQVLRI